MVPHFRVRALRRVWRARHPALAAGIVISIISCQTEKQEGFGPPPSSQAASPGDSVISESQTTPAVTQPIAGLTLTPTSASLAPGAKATFSSLGWVSGSNTPIVGTPVTWTATGGTIDSTGVYTAGSVAGSYKVTAVSKIAWKWEEATITISGAPVAVITAIALTPASVTLAPSASQQFTVSATMSNGSTQASPVVSWTASGGNVSTSGRYTAPPTSGTYQVIATSSHGMSDTSSVQVTAAVATITGLTLAPASVTLAPGGKQQFSASASLSNGSTQPNPPVTWQASGGTVSTSGMYTAPSTAGSYRLIATTSNGKADTSAVQVTAPSATINSVTLSPANVTLTAGQTQTFSASVTMSDGTTQSNPSLTWSASGGRINSSRVYTAGGATGTFGVIATSRNGKADTSTVTIVGVNSPPPSTGSGEPTPSGTILRQDNFDSYTGSRPSSPWDCTPGSTDVGMVPGRSGKAFRLYYTPSAYYSGCGLAFNRTTRIAVSYWFRINPVGYDVVENDNTGSGMKWFTLWRSGDNSVPRQTWGANHLGTSGTTFGTHDNSSSNMPNPVNGAPGLWLKVADGQWHRYTIVAYTGTGTNGYEKCWLDGALIFDTSGRGYNRSTVGFNSLGIGSDKVRAPSKNFQIDIDDFAAWIP